MAYIPTANKHEETAVNQHLVPQCYMREWSYNLRQTSVWLYEKKRNITSGDVNEISAICGSKRLEKINAIDNYYDIKAGCYFMPQEALDEIYGPTMHLKVSLDGEFLDTEKKRNSKFGLFDMWVITDDANIPLTQSEKDDLKKYFSDARFDFIEKEWGRQYESNWRTYIKDFENKIRCLNATIGSNAKNNNGVNTTITADMISEIVKMLIIFDIRGFSLNEYLCEVIDKVWGILPPQLSTMILNPNDAMHPIETTVKENFMHQYILHICYDILKDNNITGTAKVILDKYTEHLVPLFCLTDKSHPFVTSEHPVFINTDDKGKKEQIFVALPTLLISIGRGDKGHFFVSNLTPEEVDNYNKIIARNNDHIISCTDKLDTNIIFS